MKQPSPPQDLRKIAVVFIFMSLLVVNPHEGRTDSVDPAANPTTKDRVMEWPLREGAGIIQNKTEMPGTPETNGRTVKAVRTFSPVVSLKRTRNAGQVIFITNDMAQQGSGDSGKGKIFYTKLCVMCHGPEGRGDGPFGEDLVPPAANLRSSKIQGKPDQALFSAIKDGVPSSAMQAFKRRLSDQDIADVVAYVRRFGK